MGRPGDARVGAVSHRAALPNRARTAGWPTVVQSRAPLSPACTMPRHHVLIHMSNSCTKGPAMTSHATISPPEAADRLAIRELIDAYADCADRRDAKGQMALFTGDRRELLPGPSPQGGPGRAAHDDDRVHPLSRRTSQARRPAAVRRTPADGQLDRNPAVRDLTTQPVPGPGARATTRGDRWARLRRSLWQPPRPHGEQPRERVVGPLELFYDLAVVVLVAQAARHLAGHLSWRGLGEF